MATHEDWSPELELGLDIPEPPVQHVRGVTWLKYRPLKPVHCDECVREVHANWPNGTHAPNRAVYRRRSPSEPDQYYCSIHADPRKREDGK